MQGYCLKLNLQLILWVDSVAIRVRVFFFNCSEWGNTEWTYIRIFVYVYHTQSGFRVQFQAKYFSRVFEFEPRRFLFFRDFDFLTGVAFEDSDRTHRKSPDCAKYWSWKFSFLPRTGCTLPIISCDETHTNSQISWLSAGTNNVTTQPGVYEEQHLISQ